jgi:hypothetical protein
LVTFDACINPAHFLAKPIYVRAHMNMLRPFLIAASMLLTACASAPPEFERLSDASGNVIFVLEQGIQVKSGVEPIYLAAGPYRITRSGAEGAMYVGADYGVIRRTTRGYLGYPGGVWIPRDQKVTAKVFVLVGLGERLYTDLPSALTLPAEADRKMAEQAAREGIDYDKIVRQTCRDAPMTPYGATVGWASAALLCAIVESERGKPDVISELPRKELESLIGPVAPAREGP